MASVKEHYNNLLSDIYSWMFGGFNSGIKINKDFFDHFNIEPISTGIAVDLGAGCGFQSIPLAERGFNVTAFDIDKKLLEELKNNSKDLDIKIIEDDLMNFDKYISNKIELIICMTDTLLHLDSQDKVISLLKKCSSSLNKNGKLIFTFRDLTFELKDLDRFIPVRNDKDIIFTCFLEYLHDTVKVHDIVYKRDNENWILKKSFYEKLRISKDWLVDELKKNGFDNINSSVDKGLVTIIAGK